MIRIDAQIRHRLQEALPRLWWGALLAVHVPALGGVSSSILADGITFSRVGSGISLVLAMVFFLLKLRDVAFLRLRTRQQSFLAICLITAIVHQSVVTDHLNETMTVPATVCLVTTIAAVSLHRQKDHLRRWKQMLAASMTRLDLKPAVALIDHLHRSRAVDGWSFHTGAPRAPPA